MPDPSDVLAARFGSAVSFPTLEELVQIYGGEEAPAVLAELQEVDGWLDSVWPLWRQKARFDHLPYSTLFRVKEMLLRRDMLLDGRSEWGIKIVHKDGINGRQTSDRKPFPYAIPVAPPRQPYVGADPKVAAQFGARISLPHLAASTGLPIEIVEQAMAARPRSARDARAWCLQWAAEHRKPAPGAGSRRKKKEQNSDETPTDPAGDPTD